MEHDARLEESGLERLTFVLAALALGSVGLVCVPGWREEVFSALPASLRTGLPWWLPLGLADAVRLPKDALTWTLAPGISAFAAAAWLLREDSTSRAACLFRLWALVGGAIGTASWACSSFPTGGVEQTTAAVSVLVSCTFLSLALSAERLARLGEVVSVGALAVSLYALAQHFGLDVFSWSHPEVVRERSIGTLGNPDYLGAWLVGLLPWVAWIALRRRAALGQAGWGAAAGLVVVALVFTYSRGAWLGLAVEGLVVAAWSRQVRRVVIPRVCWATALVTSLVLGGATLMSTWHLPHTVTLGERALHTVLPIDPSSETRLSLWREALLVGAHHPLLGTGPGTFTQAAAPYRYVEPSWLLARVGVPGDPHNAYLEILAASGVAALAWWLAGAFVLLRRLARVAHSAGADDPAGPVLLSLTGMAVSHLFVTITLPSLWLLGLCLALGVRRLDVLGEPAPRYPAWRSLGVLVLGLGLAATVVAASVSIRALRADMAFRLGRELGTTSLRVSGEQQRRMLEESLALYQRAAEEASGVRRGNILLSRGKLLEEVFLRVAGTLHPLEASALAARAEESYRGAIACNPFDSYRWQDLGRLLLRVGMEEKRRRATSALATMDRGLDASRQACHLDPYNAVLWGDLARGLADAGRLEESERAFRRSLDLAPGQVPIRLDLGRLLASQGRRGPAEDEFRRVLELDPSNEAARAALAAPPSKETSPEPRRP